MCGFLRRQLFDLKSSSLFHVPVLNRAQGDGKRGAFHYVYELVKVKLLHCAFKIPRN